MERARGAKLLTRVLDSYQRRHEREEVALGPGRSELIARLASAA